MIDFSSKGDWHKTFRFLEKASKNDVLSILSQYGQKGVDALRAATPKKSGKTAMSWSYEIVKTGGGWTIQWKNSNVNSGVNIAVILQTGHGTGTGGYVRGIDYINPALEPIFKELAKQAFEEVTGT